MAGRIRSLKPELLDLACAAGLSSDAWRLWVSMMLLADDHGNLRAASRLLAANVFQDTGQVDVVVEAMAELVLMPEACRVDLYRVGGEVFAHLNGFADDGCPPIRQYLKRTGQPRVPPPTHHEAEPVVANTDGYESFDGKCPRISASRGDPRKVSADFRESRRPTESVRGFRRVAADFGESRRNSASRARAPISDLRSPISDLRSPIVAVPDPGHRARDPEADPDLEDVLGLGTPEPSSSDHDDGGQAFEEEILRKPEDPPPPPEPEPIRRLRYETQFYPGTGRPIIDPETGSPLVLDLAALAPEQVAAERERCLAAAPAPPPPSAPPGPSESTADLIWPRDDEPLPPAYEGPGAAEMAAGDTTLAMRALLAAAPPPVCFLAEGSASRLAAGFLGGQLRIAEVPDLLRVAAMKLDRRLLAITAESPPEELEHLHRWVCTFLRPDPARRARAPAPPDEAAARLLRAYADRYKARFKTPYQAAAEDIGHAAAIAQDLGRRLDAALAEDPKLDRDVAKKRLASALFEAWFNDPFGARAGHSLCQLARLVRTEPNRFQISAKARARAAGASGAAPEPAPSPRVPPSPERIAEIEAEMRRIGGRGT